MVRAAIILLLALFLCCGSRPPANAQGARGQYDTILMGGIVVGVDTFAYSYLADVTITRPLPAGYASRHRVDMTQLRYNVQIVYPYAVIAAEVLKDVDVSLARCPDKPARKAYLKKVEAELNKRFKGQLKNLTITQGQILVKLIDRQTGKNCYSIISEMKGGFNAFVWQGVALLFSNNLKREYDPQDRDRDIESIVQDIEATAWRNYYIQQQRAKGK